MNASPGKSNQILERLVKEVLDLLPEPVQQVMRLGAISPSFTPDLLQLLAGGQISVADALHTLEEFHFLNQESGTWYSYSPDVRAILSRYWQQSEHRQEFQDANRIAFDYFINLATQVNPPITYAYQRQAIYHQLLNDEEAGLEHFSVLFEQACDYHQLGVAQDLLTSLTEAQPWLSPNAAEHSTYYRARLDFLFNRRPELEGFLKKISSEPSDTLLKARAGVLLGQIWLSQYEWKKSADILNSSLTILKNLKAWTHATKAMLILGDLYLKLVKYSGGANPGYFQPWNGLDRVLQFLAYLPYLILEWLRRKATFFPNRLSFSMNYQDWILNYLLRKAENWYYKAWQLALSNKDDSAIFNALIGQGEVAIEQGREGTANHIFADLTRLPLVAASRYRTARVLYGSGQLSVLMGKQIQAIRDLQGALEIFRDYEDTASIAQVTRGLGVAYKQFKDEKTAAQVLLESFEAFQALEDPLSQTQVAWLLEELHTSSQVTFLTKQQMISALGTLVQRQYIARFPDELLNRTRSLAYKTVFPIFYVSALVLGSVASLLTLILEIIAVKLTHGLSPLQFILYFLIILSPIWIVEFLYIILGQASLRAMSRKSLDLLGEQPDRIITSAEALIISRANSSELIHIPWHEIQTSVSANFRLWKKPISLVSRHYLNSTNQTHVLEGVINGYSKLVKEIQEKAQSKTSQLSSDLTILTNPWVYLAISVSFLQGVLLVILKQIEITAQDEITCKFIPLLFSPLLITFVTNLIVLLPPATLWQIIAQRRYLAQHVNYQSRMLGGKLLLSLAILLSLVAVIWLVITPVLKIGDASPPPANDCVPQQTILLNTRALSDQINHKNYPQVANQADALINTKSIYSLDFHRYHLQARANTNNQTPNKIEIEASNLIFL